MLPAPTTPTRGCGLLYITNGIAGGEAVGSNEWVRTCVGMPTGGKWPVAISGT